MYSYEERIRAVKFYIKLGKCLGASIRQLGNSFRSLIAPYVHWYDEKRIKISLDSLSPLEYRASLGLTA